MQGFGCEYFVPRRSLIMNGDIKFKILNCLIVYAHEHKVHLIDCLFAVGNIDCGRGSLPSCVIVPKGFDVHVYLNVICAVVFDLCGHHDADAARIIKNGYACNLQFKIFRVQQHARQLIRSICILYIAAALFCLRICNQLRKFIVGERGNINLFCECDRADQQHEHGHDDQRCEHGQHAAHHAPSFCPAPAARSRDSSRPGKATFC